MLRSNWLNAFIAAGVLAALAALAGCGQYSPIYLRPLSPQTRALLAEKGMAEDSPVLIRIFKAESELEVWKQKDDGRFYLFKTYPICDWSGTLGPKINQGDRQAPEGFYLVSADQMNPNSKYHLSFNVGFPNAHDRALGWTGADIMVHGDCKSAGCYAMTDAVVEEIFILAHDALEGGQPAFQIQAYPFRMTAANMEQHKNDKWYDFWKELKQGYDYFEVTHLQPKVDTCDHHYLVNVAFAGGVTPNPGGACPSYSRLPVSPAPKQPAQQQASVKTQAWQVQSRPGSSADAGVEAKPFGAMLNLTFGPQKPAYTAMTLGPATPVTPTAAPDPPVQKRLKAAASSGKKDATASPPAVASAAPGH